MVAGLASLFIKDDKPNNKSQKQSSSAVNTISSFIPSQEKRELKRRIKQLEKDIQDAKVNRWVGSTTASTFDIKTGVASWKTEQRTNQIKQMERELQELKRAYRRMN